jgi:hypothetical protein
MPEDKLELEREREREREREQELDPDLRGGQSNKCRSVGRRCGPVTAALSRLRSPTGR